MYTMDVGYLSDDFIILEKFFKKVVDAPPCEKYAFDMSNVKFMTPANIVGVIIGARFLVGTDGMPVLVINASQDILNYLERMNVFQVGNQWLSIEDNCLIHQWGRSGDSDNLLELRSVSSKEDIWAIVKQVDDICRPLELEHLGAILTIISELCQNALDHSGNASGMIIVQRYHNRKTDKTTVHISIGDSGKGVRRSLVERHGEFADNASDYLVAALEGKTARLKGGGLGLRTIEDTITRENGFLWFRSYDGVVISRGANMRRKNDQQANIPGTQVTVKLEGPLPLEYKL